MKGVDGNATVKPRSLKIQGGFAKWERPSFWLLVLVAVAMIWIPQRLPLVDLPQHAAQVVAWRALVEGHYIWADLLQITYGSPYLLGYALLLPLSYVMSMVIATKFLLSVIFVAFISLCILLRRELGGDKGLDWLFLFGFFGFAWRWGFLTYLCAAPLVVLFVIVALRQARENSWRNQLFVLLLGSLLLLSHGLQFLFAVAIGGLFILVDGRGIGYKIRAYLPYFMLAILMVGVWWAMSLDKNPTVTQQGVYGHTLWYRPLSALFRVSGNELQDWPGVVPPLLAFAVPLLPGHRRQPVQAWIPFAVCAAVLLFAPHGWMSAAYVWQRFALFLLPFWALAFRADEASETPAWQAPIRFAILAIAAFASVVLFAQRQFALARDSIGFETVLAAAEPNRRALSLIYESSEPNSSVPEYLHYPAWYQVEKGGFVDFNFGYFYTSIARYRSDRIPSLSRMGWPSPQSDIAGDLPLYDYLFIRGTPEELEQMKKNNAQCRFRVRAQDGLWYLLEKEECTR